MWVYLHNLTSLTISTPTLLLPSPPLNWFHLYLPAQNSSQSHPVKVCVSSSHLCYQNLSKCETPLTVISKIFTMLPVPNPSGSLSPLYLPSSNTLLPPSHSSATPGMPLAPPVYIPSRTLGITFEW
jgi:hypothetical protein